jgi:hypothetical protein
VGWALLGCYLLHAGGGKEREEKGFGPDSARREKKEERNPFPFCIFFLFSVFKTLHSLNLLRSLKPAYNL